MSTSGSFDTTGLRIGNVEVQAYWPHSLVAYGLYRVICESTADSELIAALKRLMYDAGSADNDMDMVDDFVQLLDFAVRVCNQMRVAGVEFEIEDKAVEVLFHGLTDIVKTDLWWAFSDPDFRAKSAAAVLKLKELEQSGLPNRQKIVDGIIFVVSTGEGHYGNRSYYDAWLRANGYRV